MNRILTVGLSLLLAISLTGCETIPTTDSTSTKVLPAFVSSLPSCRSYPGPNYVEPCHGRVFLDSNNSYIDGEIRNRAINGMGLYVINGASVYLGEFRNNKKHGYGTYIFENGTTYSGWFQNDEIVKNNSQHLQSQTSHNTSSANNSNSMDQALRLAREHQERQNNQNIRPQNNHTINSQPGLYEQYLRQSAQQQQQQQQHQRVVREQQQQHHQRVVREQQQQQHQRVVREQQQQTQQHTTTVVNNGTSERRVALVIGNADYPRNRLANAVNDAVDVAAALRNLGFQVMLVQNASLATMRQRTSAFAEQASTADVALIYYSGHGIEHAGTNFLIPANVASLRATEIEYETFNVSRWISLFSTQQSNRRNRVNIMIIDACRDSGISLGLRNMASSSTRITAPSGTLIAYSTSPGKVAIDGLTRERNSPYTKNLLRVISQPNLPVEQMFKNVRRMVIEQTGGQQVPWETSSLTGNFVFRRSS